jgi:hypothetical protein
VIEVLGLATYIDHAVDRAGSAEYAAAGVVDGAAVGAGIGFRLEPPGERRVLQQLHIPGGDMDQRLPVAPAGLDQHHAVGGIFSQSIGQAAAGRTGADDHIVRLHWHSPPGSYLTEIASPLRGSQ